MFPRIGFADFVFCIFCLQLHIVRWPPPRFWHGAKRRGYWPQNLSYVLHFHVLMDSRLASGRSGSKKVRFFFTPFSRKIGLKTGIEIVLGTLFNSGCDACFLIFFFFFLVNLGNNINGPKNVTFQFFVGPFFIISQRVFALFKELTVPRWLGPVLGVMCSSHILRPPCLRNGAHHREGALLIICTRLCTGLSRLICFSKTRFLYFS